MSMVSYPPISACLSLTRAISRATSAEDIYTAALDALALALDVSRASVLLCDADGVMRFKAWRGLSDTYRDAVEGHTPWTADTRDPQPVVVSDVSKERTLDAFREVILAEGIAAMAFIPLVSTGRVIGKFMLYYDAPHVLGEDERQLAEMISAQVAFALERMRAEVSAQRGAPAIRPRCRGHGHVGSGSLESGRHLVGTLRADSRLRAGHARQLVRELRHNHPLRGPRPRAGVDSLGD